MFRVSRLLLIAALAQLVLAMIAGSAAAQMEVVHEDDGSHCPAVTIDVHDVEGGCHFRFQSTVDVTMHIYLPGKVTFSSCEMTLEGRVGEGGEGYVTSAVLEPPQVGPTPCTRAACDEAAPSHTMIPWPFHIGGHGPDGDMSIELCLRPSSSGEGGSGGWCDLDIDLGDRDGHLYELGHLDGPDDPVEVSCENYPGADYTGPHSDLPAPVSFEAHLQTSPAGDEDFEVAQWDSPPVTVLAEAGSECPPVTAVGHQVEGGCHVEFESTGNGIPWHAYAPAKTTIMNCDWELEARVNGNGEGYVTQAILTAASVGPPCNRAACDEAAPSHAMIPWPLHIAETAPGDQELELTLCLRLSSAGEGDPGIVCELHLEVGNHGYELGHADGGSGRWSGAEVFCENSPPNSTEHPTLAFPASFEPHLVTTGLEETVEIVH